MYFSESGRIKYFLEAMKFQLLISHLPSSLVQHIIWDMFLNTHAGTGKNFPSDLHNEHIKSLKKVAHQHILFDDVKQIIGVVKREKLWDWIWEICLLPGIALPL